MKTSTTQIAMMAFGAIGLVVIGVIWLRHEMQPKARKAAQSMAGPRDVARLTPKQVEKTARRLRKLDGKVTPGETGIAIGRLVPHGPQLRTTWRDGMLAIMAPGGGKTACLAGPAGLEADGPVVDTSNKRDLRDILIQRAGKHWTFDPQRIVGPQDFWWDALDGLDNVSDAHNFAAQFVTTIEDDSKRDIWGPSAIQLIRAYTLAANLIGGDMLDIYRWICDPDTGEALDILDRHGFAQVVQGVNVTLNSASNTRKGVYITAKTAMQCLEDPTISRWVTRQPGLPCFDPEAFVAGTDTLHLLSKDGGEGASPLVAAFTARVLDAGVRYAERQTKRPARAADGRHPRRSEERVPDRQAPAALLALRLAQHLADAALPELRADGERLGQDRRRRNVDRQHRQAHRLRPARRPLRKRHFQARRQTLRAGTAQLHDRAQRRQQ